MAAQQQLRSPPTLEDEAHYGEWLIDLEIWQLYTDLNANKQGPAVYLSLSGRTRECVRELSKEEIGGENGGKTFTDILDSVF